MITSAKEARLLLDEELKGIEYILSAKDIEYIRHFVKYTLRESIDNKEKMLRLVQ